MRRFRIIFWLSFPLLFLSFPPSPASARPSYSRYSEAPEGKVFLSPVPNFRGSSFFSKWSGAVNERDKIRYLLGRLAGSDEHFIRNGRLYDGKEARQWLLFKLSRWTSEVKTAQDFIERLSFSRQTGKPYLVASSEGGVYSLKSVLKNELSAFEYQLLRIAEMRREALPKPGQVSISPPAVASTAVAQSSR